MATLLISVSGEPKTGKTAVLANIAKALAPFVEVTWENPALPTKDNAKIVEIGDNIPTGTRVVLQEVYLPNSENLALPAGAVKLINPLDSEG